MEKELILATAAALEATRSQRKQLEQEETTLSKKLATQMVEFGATSLAGQITSGGSSVIVTVERKEVSSRTLDVAKLAPLLSMDQLMASVKVTIGDAEKMLTKAQVASCSIPGPSRVSYAIKVLAAG